MRGLPAGSVSAILALAVLLPGSAWAVDDMQTLRDQIARMQRELQEMNTRLQALEKQSATATGVREPSASPHVPAAVLGATDDGQSVLPTRESVADHALAASRPGNHVAPTGAGLKGFFVVPDTDTMIRLGGYAKLDAIADSHAAGNPDQFVIASMSVGGSDRDTRHFQMHAKQTRFSFEARRPTASGSLRFYLENDFFGSRDGYDFRLRHAYGQLGNTFAGYGFSAFVDADSFPDTLDFAGPGAASNLRLAGIHHSFRIGGGRTLTLAAENPDAQLADTAAAGVDTLPDLALAVRTERAWGHVQLGMVARRLGLGLDGQRRHAYGGGMQVSGALAAFDRDLVLFGLLGGKGIARYSAGLSGRGLDAVLDPSGELQALPVYGGFLGYAHHWSGRWRSNLVFSELRLDGQGLLAANEFRRGRYGALNLIWSPAPSWTMGMELLYGQLQLQEGSSAETVRMQGSLKYDFIN